MTNLAIQAEENIQNLHPIQDGFEQNRMIESLVHTYYDDVYQLACHILEDVNDADDMTQETFIKAATNMDEFRGDATLKTWLFSIAINQCRQFLRKKKSRQKLTTTLKQITRLIKKATSPEEVVSSGEANAQLWTAVSQLKEKHRLPIILHYVYDFSTQEIATILNTKAGTIQSRLHYVRHQLHHVLVNQNHANMKRGK